MSEASEEHAAHIPSYLKPKKDTLNSLLASGHVNKDSVIKSLFREISHIEKVQSEVISKQRDVIKELEESESVEIGDLSRELKQSRQEVLSILKTQGQYLHHISKNIESKCSSTSNKEVTDLPDPIYFYEDDNFCTLKERCYKEKIIYIKNQLKTQMEFVSKHIEYFGIKKNNVLFCDTNSNRSKNLNSQVHLYPVPSLKFNCNSRPHGTMKFQELDILQSPLVSFSSPPELIKQMEGIYTLSANVGTQNVNSFYDMKGKGALGQCNSYSVPMSDMIPSALLKDIELQSEELYKSIQKQIETTRNGLQDLEVQMSHLQASKTPNVPSIFHNEAHTIGENSTLFDGREVIEWNEFQSCVPRNARVSKSKSKRQGKLKSLERMTNGACTYVQNDVSAMYPPDQRLEIEPLCSNTNHTSFDFRDRRSRKISWIKKLKRIKKRQRQSKVGEIYDAVKAFDERTF